MRWWLFLFLWLLLSLVSCNKSKKDKCESDSDSASDSDEQKGKRRLKPTPGCEPAPGSKRGDGFLPGSGSRLNLCKNKPKPLPKACKNPTISSSCDFRGKNKKKCLRELDRCPCKLKGKGEKPEQEFDKFADKGPAHAKCCMKHVTETLENGNYTSALEAVEKLEETLEETDLNETMSLFAGRFVALLHKPQGAFKGLNIYASDSEAKSERAVANSKVHIQFPKELGAESNNTIVFCMVSLPQKNETTIGSEVLLYENRLIGLRVRGKKVSSLKEHVNITLNLTTGINDTLEPKCVFLNFSTHNFSDYGCKTHRTDDQVVCSCNHFTYFGILMVSRNITSTDQVNLSYITVIGCSISLLALLITVLLFITKRTIRADVSMKVHINLAIALILLNVHLLPSQAVAALPSDGLCFYMALLLHYSLLATFIWMALEGFHLYLLLVKVFNIYIRKYLLKLSLVGWGVPAVIVSIVVGIDRNFYGRTPDNSQISNSTEICYIKNYTVKMVTTVGLFSAVFVFNFIMLIVTVRRVLSIRHSKEYGQNESSRARRDVCTLLGISVLLGTTWGLIFFSFGNLPIAGLYAFCILNSLQGFFIFLWFVMSMRKTGNSTTKTSSDTRSSHG